MVAEVDPRSPSATDGTGAISAIRRAVADAHQVSLHAVALVPAGSLPKTTSGKLQRFLCRDGFLGGEFQLLASWSETRHGAGAS